jgi:hypothetical protein
MKRDQLLKVIQDIQGLCKEIGFDGYFNKPIKRDQLLHVIQKCTGLIHESQL